MSIIDLNKHTSVVEDWCSVYAIKNDAIDTWIKHVSLLDYCSTINNVTHPMVISEVRNELVGAKMPNVL